METEVKVKTEEPVKPVVVRRHGALERFPWQRLALSVFGIMIIVLKWRWGINHLYTLPPASYSAFTSATTNSDYVIGGIVIFMITGKLVYDWKNQTVSDVVQHTQNLFEKRDEHIEQVITTRTEGGAKAFVDGTDIP